MNEVLFWKRELLHFRYAVDAMVDSVSSVWRQLLMLKKWAGQVPEILAEMA